MTLLSDVKPGLKASTTKATAQAGLGVDITGTDVQTQLTQLSTQRPTLTGGNASGTWPISITGTANTASVAGGVTQNSYSGGGTFLLCWQSGNPIYTTPTVFITPNLGAITATTFIGALTGNATSSTTSGTATNQSGGSVNATTINGSSWVN